MFRTLLVLLAVLAPGTLLGQHAYTDDELAEGGRLYRENCSKCHGDQGNALAGIDLGRGQYRKPMSDADVARLIRIGIPNTTMAPVNISEAQAGTVVAFMRTLTAANRSRTPSALPAGDAVRGSVVFEVKGNCLSCHRVREKGSRLGPNLTEVGTRRRQPEIELALTVPNAEVQPGNRMVRVVPKTGQTVTGRLLNHDAMALLMIDNTEKLRSFQKLDLKEWTFIDSPMPSYRDKLTPQELADVVSYLLTLKVQVTP